MSVTVFADPVAALLDSFREQIVALVERDPQVPVVLEALREAGWRISIATNGSTAQQCAKIRRTGLDAHADAVAVSEEVGVAKPDRRMFEAAAQRCGADTARRGSHDSVNVVRTPLWPDVERDHHMGEVLDALPSLGPADEIAR